MSNSFAQEKANRWSLKFRNLFRQQFTLSRKSDLEYPGFARHNLNGWVLRTGRAIRLANVNDIDGKPIGFLLGITLQDGEFVSGDLTVLAKDDDKTLPFKIDQLVNSLAGRFVIIILTSQLQQVYVNPVCDMPVVYEPQRQILGSSLSLILHRPFERNQLFNLNRILRGHSNFSNLSLPLKTEPLNL